MSLTVELGLGALSVAGVALGFLWLVGRRFDKEFGSGPAESTQKTRTG